MRIVAIEATPFTLTRRTAVRARTISSDRSRHVLVRVRTDDGISGVAEALSKVPIYGETQASIVAIIAERIAPDLVGLDAFDLEEADRRLGRIPANNTARAAVDIALHDVVGKARGVSLHGWWGGTRAEQRVSWTLGIAAPAEMAAEAVAIHDGHGIEAFKIKGGESPEDDVEAVRLVRERLPRAHLSLDANEGYDAPTAIATLDRMADFDLAYVEEPIPRDDRSGRVEAARRIPMPILGDDSCFSLRDVVREIDLGAIGMVSIKTPRTGFLESGRILAAAEAAGLSCVVGTAVGGGLSSLAALQFSCAHDGLAGPSENSFGLNLVDDIVEAPKVQDGRLALPAGPGIGAEVIPERLDRLAIG